MLHRSSEGFGLPSLLIQEYSQLPRVLRAWLLEGFPQAVASALPLLSPSLRLEDLP